MFTDRVTREKVKHGCM